ncbi:hypothetical protein N7520_010467 [Penicillium odoratum]|uniref:uncharacterized protein n=1 Tax=Penicillium odoratum TaxID=1167516 RepID=UPI0025478159|nr:uncharacterized protein N7520_010467 [Penicillium odoratum]KAJ5745285.1 hypothetical protein N7520_010467 [Penicillium odoratum]
MPASQQNFIDPSGMPIPLAQSELSPADNWQGLADAKERRKRQNRINQRRHREAKRKKHVAKQITSITAGHLGLVAQTVDLQTSHQSPSITELAILDAASIPQSNNPYPSPETPSRTDQDFSPESPQMMTLWFTMPCPKKRAALLEQLATYHNSYTMNCPLSNHLLTLTKTNVHRAFVANMASLGITWEWMEEDSISPFSIPGPAEKLLPVQKNLHPTALQRSTVHHTWIDLFPCPLMRDNLVRAGNDWDDEELCTDIMGFWNGNSPDPHGLIVWGDPAELSNWELQPGFVKKWGWVIRGCDDIIHSTNKWRAKRGERPLFSTSFLLSA